jgi:hypothetical protein
MRGKHKKNVVTKLIIAILIIGFVVLLGYGFNIYRKYQVKTENKNQEAREEEILRKQELNIKRNKMLEEAASLFKGYYVDEAISLLKSDKKLSNDEVLSKIEEYQKYKDSYVLYDGAVEHIFFHSLILYPEYLFKDITKPAGGLNEGFSYKSELERMLPLLLERGFVLFNINDVFGKDENGIMKRKDIYLPPSKKPLILSIDDPAYANSDATYNLGLANRMIIDENGKLATEVYTPEKELITTYDGDVELVVNNFIEKNPGFSYRGARGIIASTGYLGIFGYDLDTQESKDKATAVANKLKEQGWLFASHSYTHNRDKYWGPNSDPTRIANDTKKWKEVIEPIIGKTNIFIAPFGYTLKGEAMNVIINNGFDIYCNVALTSRIIVNDNYALMSRIEMGGYSYSKYTKYINERLFEVDKVRDTYRPPVLSS